MCGPAAVPIAMWASVALAAAGTAYSVDASNKAAQAQEEQAAENAKDANQQAKSVEQAGYIQEDQQRQRTRQMLASQRAALAANNVDSTTGTPAELLGDTASMGEQDALTIRANAARQAWGIQSGAVNDINQANVAKTSAKNNAVGSYLTLAGNTASGISRNPSAYGFNSKPSGLTTG